jgi:tRNA (cytidine/uridine-2'-O-)-methyltransferase
MRLALYQPDIAPNTGTLIRLGACLGVAVDIVEPCGFLFSDARLRRAGMDYLDRADVVRHPSWKAFRAARAGTRLVLLTTKAVQSYLDFAFHPDDVLILGRESEGVPQDVHQQADARLRIPLKARSLNVALAGAIVLAEALRQIGGFSA